jgi:hypothetical protein
MIEIARLRQTIRDLHVQVHGVFDGKTVRKGEAQVFPARGHPTASRAYTGEIRHLAALGMPPIKAAVTAHIEEQQKHRGGT